MRRDLDATREKTGVYIAHDNYTHMVQKLEEQENEIMEKISSIKAIKEEMDKKEACFLLFSEIILVYKYYFIFYLNCKAA